MYIIFIISHELYLDSVEYYLSHVSTKILIVGRAQRTRNQNHEYYLDCLIIFRAISTIWIVLELQTRAMSIKITYFYSSKLVQFSWKMRVRKSCLPQTAATKSPFFATPVETGRAYQ